MALTIVNKAVGDQLTATEFNELVNESKKIHPIDQELSGVISDYHVFGKLNGFAEAMLGKTYKLDLVGDYVEWVGRFTATSYMDGLGLIGFKEPYNKNILGYFDEYNVYLRGNNTAEAYTVWNVPEGVTDFKKFRLEVVTGGWELFVNGKSLGVQTKPTELAINNIGAAYHGGNMVKADMKHFAISSGTGVLSISDLANYTGSESINKVVEKKGFTYSPAFVSFDPVGGPNAAGLFTVYTRFSDDSMFYAGYKIAHIIDTNIRADMWRIYGADLFEYRSGVMFPRNKSLVASQDSECTFKQSGKTDFTGGYHGDEMLTDVKFFINGIALTEGELSEAFTLKPAKDFYFIQKSDMLETDNATDTVIAKHDKKTAIKGGGYYTFNRVEFLVAMTIQTAYISGISSISRDPAETVFSENFNYVSMVEDGAEKINEIGARELNYYSGTNHLGCFVTSNFLKPAAYDAETVLIVWDVSNYSKYYRRLSDKAVAAGEVWEGETTVKHFNK